MFKFLVLPNIFIFNHNPILQKYEVEYFTDSSAIFDILTCERHVPERLTW